MNALTNAALWDRRNAVLPRGAATMHPRFVARASNDELFDVEGNRYIDMAAGIAVCNTGHSNPRVVEAVKRQLDNFSHSCFHVNPYESYVALAEELCRRAPISGPAKAMFFTTGAEALENIVKITRAATGRRGIITFRGGFHGRTIMAMTMTGKTNPYKMSFGPYPAEVYHAAFPVAYHGIDEEAAIAGLEGIFAADIPPSDVAAIVVEPVQGEGGFYTASYAFFRQLRAICDRHGIMLVCDEVQTGFARTGKFFAMDWCDVKPDIITVAKAMGGGFPISGVVGRADILDGPHPGGIGGTYAGSPLACAAGLEVIRIIDEERLCDRAIAIGNIIKGRLRTLQQQGMGAIGDVRGPGAMVAMELIRDRNPDRPDAELPKLILTEALKEGLILLACGVRGNVIRFLPVLTASDALIEEGMDKLEAVLRRVIPVG
jgi:4-aminobutyrate aminotransferase/(S)-3-amino-2-methylpropionate transaminase